MRKVLVITGTRADYGIYYPILKEIEQDLEMELHLLVTGMHLSPQYGFTVQDIRQDGFRISAQVDCLLQGSSHANMARSIGLALIGMTQAIESIQPDQIMILGDRGEMLSAAIAASHMNIPVFHLHGGEVSGTIDESVRHAISKLAHIHLVATELSGERLQRMGEDHWRIHIVGAPRIETILTANLLPLKSIKEKYKLQHIKDYILFIYHPVTTERNFGEALKPIIQTLINTGYDIICVMPNADAGTDIIMNIYKSFQGHPKYHLITNFEKMDYLTVLKEARILVGNSSSGIIEAASFHVPVINIGSRQEKRERSSNVIDSDENPENVKKLVEYALSKQFKELVQSTNNVYQQENTSKKILGVLKETIYSESLIQKTITY
ncbi:UDP-N-acetylglucosamine 2-epimerase [Paenibacillus sp. WLX2291]|uniref:UDP-N-acetylglucosamine 2-epimerase n=1 Tax=Paenibacillus sp. WLX2291 TaxID=3296934 RepID=UPI00398449FD